MIKLALLLVALAMLFAIPPHLLGLFAGWLARRCAGLRRKP